MTHRRVFTGVALLLAFAAFAYADATGKWAAEFDTPIGQQKYTFDLKADGSKLTGTATSPRGAQAIQDGKITGDQISFVETLDMQGQSVKIEYTGKLTGDELKLTRKVGDFGETNAVAKRTK